MSKSTSLVVVLFALGLSAGSTAFGEQGLRSGQDPKKDEKPASVAGNWNMSVNGPQGPMAISMALTQDGRKLTGNLSSQMGDTGLEGEFADGKISFVISFQGNSGATQISFVGMLKEDGTLEGTLSGEMGDMTWTAERVKTHLPSAVSS